MFSSYRNMFGCRAACGKGLMMSFLVFGACGRLLAQAQNASEDIRGPKALIEIPKPEQTPIALWIGIVCGIFVLIVAWLLMRKFSNRKLLKSPSGIALAALAEVERSSEQLSAENFANRAALTLRQYIAARFAIAAPLRTTEEFLHELSTDGASPLAERSDYLKAFLKSCDLAKFAGAKLTSDQRHDLLRDARAFVTATAQPIAVSKDAKS